MAFGFRPPEKKSPGGILISESSDHKDVIEDLQQTGPKEVRELINKIKATEQGTETPPTGNPDPNRTQVLTP